MKKLFFIAILLFCVLLIQTKVNSLNYSYTCHKIDEVGPWYDPFRWFTNYDNVTSYVYVLENTKEVLIFIECTGIADRKCENCYCSLSPMDSVLNQPFLNTSTSMMESYAKTSIMAGVLTGYQSYNTIYNNHSVYRNVSWQADSTNGVQYYIVIAVP